MSITTMKRLTAVLPIVCLLVAVGMVIHQYWRLSMLQHRLDSLRGAISRTSNSAAHAHPEEDHLAVDNRD